MGSNLSNGFAIYPMVEEAEATGVVAGVYAELLTQLPFVPSLFKSLAVCPQYLVLAYEQAAGVLGGERFTDCANALAASVRGGAKPPEQEQLRQTLAQFVGPLARMLVLSCGLLLALQDQLDAPPAVGSAPPARPVGADRGAPSQWESAAPEVYGEIRAALETPMINTIWRQLAAQGQLESAWAALRPQVAASRPAADALQQRALDVARDLPWSTAATPAALATAGVADAAPGMAALLDAYIKTLPRVLALASSSSTQ